MSYPHFSEHQIVDILEPDDQSNKSHNHNWRQPVSPLFKPEKDSSRKSKKKALITPKKNPRKHKIQSRDVYLVGVPQQPDELWDFSGDPNLDSNDILSQPLLFSIDKNTAKIHHQETERTENHGKQISEQEKENFLPTAPFSENRYSSNITSRQILWEEQMASPLSFQPNLTQKTAVTDKFRMSPIDPRQSDPFLSKRSNHFSKNRLLNSVSDWNTDHSLQPNLNYPIPSSKTSDSPILPNRNSLLDFWLSFPSSTAKQKPNSKFGLLNLPSIKRAVSLPNLIHIPPAASTQKFSLLSSAPASLFQNSPSTPTLKPSSQPSRSVSTLKDFDTLFENSPCVPTSLSASNSKAYILVRILSVTKNSYNVFNQKGSLVSKPQLKCVGIQTLSDPSNSHPFQISWTVLLRDEWISTPIFPGDFCNLISSRPAKSNSNKSSTFPIFLPFDKKFPQNPTFSPTSLSTPDKIPKTPSDRKIDVSNISPEQNSNQFIIDSNSNMIIINPQILVSPSDIVSKSQSSLNDCDRRDLLTYSTISSPFIQELTPICGQIVHAVFQTAFLRNQWDIPFLWSVFEEIIPPYAPLIASLHFHDSSEIEYQSQLEAVFRASISGIHHWGSVWMNTIPSADSPTLESPSKVIPKTSNSDHSDLLSFLYSPPVKNPLPKKSLSLSWMAKSPIKRTSSLPIHIVPSYLNSMNNSCRTKRSRDEDLDPLFSLENFTPEIADYIHSPNIDSFDLFGRNFHQISKHDYFSELSIVGCSATEETISSFMFGIRGSIDATCKVHSNSMEEDFILPLEVKTTPPKKRLSSSIYHNGQIILYTLCLMDRYSCPVSHGILLYLPSPQLGADANPTSEFWSDTSSSLTQTISADYLSIQSLLQIRNSIASARFRWNVSSAAKKTNPTPLSFPMHLQIKYETSFPKSNPIERKEEESSLDDFSIFPTTHNFPIHLPPLEFSVNESCPKCPTKTLCYGLSSPWLGKWYSMLQESADFTSSSNISLISNSSTIRGPSNPKSSILGPMFFKERRDSKIIFQSKIPFSEMTNYSIISFWLKRGIVLTISTGIQFHLCKGTLVASSPSSLTLKLSNTFTTFAGNLSNSPDFYLPTSDFKFSSDNSHLYPQSFYFSLYAPSQHRHVRGWLENTVNSQKLQPSIISLEKPVFQHLSSIQLPTAETCTNSNIYQSFAKLYSTLNSPQRDALKMCFAGSNYSLVVGPPGTGKSFFIVCSILAWLSSHPPSSKILISSGTNNALDGIVRTLISFGVDSVLRIGNPTRIAQDLQMYSISSIANSCPSLESLITTISSCQVFAVTCRSSYSQIVSGFSFDIAFIDEACQITLPDTLGPIQWAKRFCLVGDPHQLGPIVSKFSPFESPDANHRIDPQETLFSILSKNHPHSVTMFTHQYRMASEICHLVNNLVYNHKLITAQEPAPLSLHISSYFPKWLRTALKSIHPVSFVNVHPIQPQFVESISSDVDSIPQNPFSQAIFDIVSCLLSSGLHSENVGVITAYRKQVDSLRSLIRPLGDISIATVDKFQGKEKPVIIIDLSNLGLLWESIERINVAITRAKNKVIFVGNFDSVLQSLSNPNMRSMFSIIQKKGLITDAVLFGSNNR